MSKAEKVLVDQQEALWNYLDALLQEIPEEIPEAPVEVTVAPPAVVPEEIQEWDPVGLDEAPAVESLAPAPEPVFVPVAEPAVEPAAVEEVEEPASLEAAPEPVAEEQAAPEPQGPPAWSNPDFQALLFKVDGLTLAVPLVKLHSVIPWVEEDVTALPNQPDWCRGIVRYRERNVKVVDTGGLVIPEDKRAQLEPQEPRHILIVGDGKWGLACTALGEVIRLDPEEVKWRSGKSRRPWLAGTVLGHLCALLDTEAFAGMLKDAPPQGKKTRPG